MGLCMLDEMQTIAQNRQSVYRRYKSELSGWVQLQEQNINSTQNYGYFPIILKDEKQTLRVQKALNDKNIFPRRYFYPSLDTLSYIEPKQFMSISRDISSRVLCLPIYPGLVDDEQSKIIAIVRENI